MNSNKLIDRTSDETSAFGLSRNPLEQLKYISIATSYLLKNYNYL